jgi:CsoR family transcriptional regulator, copper-sensing transcriptional repressor
MSDTDHEKLQKRLNRIEGQVRGISRMLEDDRPANEILQQLLAVRAALISAAGVVAERHLIEQLDTLGDTKNKAAREKVTKSLVHDLLRLVKS